MASIVSDMKTGQESVMVASTNEQIIADDEVSNIVASVDNNKINL